MLNEPCCGLGQVHTPGDSSKPGEAPTLALILEQETSDKHVRYARDSQDTGETA